MTSLPPLPFLKKLSSEDKAYPCVTGLIFQPNQHKKPTKFHKAHCINSKSTYRVSIENTLEYSVSRTLRLCKSPSPKPFMEFMGGTLISLKIESTLSLGSSEKWQDLLLPELWNQSTCIINEFDEEYD